MTPLGDPRLADALWATLAAVALAGWLVNDAHADTIIDDPQTPWAECWTPGALSALALTPGLGYAHEQPVPIENLRGDGDAVRWGPLYGLGYPGRSVTIAHDGSALPLKPLHPQRPVEPHIPPIPVPALMPFLVGALSALGVMLALRGRR